MTLLERAIPAATVAALTEVRRDVLAWVLEVGLDEATAEDMSLAVYGHERATSAGWTPRRTLRCRGRPRR